MEAAGAGNSRCRRAPSVKNKLFLILFFLFLFSSSTTQAAPAPAKAATGRKLSQANTKKPAVREISV